MPVKILPPGLLTALSGPIGGLGTSAQKTAFNCGPEANLMGQPGCRPIVKVAVLKHRLLARRTGRQLPSTSTPSEPINWRERELSESSAASPAEVLRPRPERCH